MLGRLIGQLLASRRAPASREAVPPGDWIDRALAAAAAGRHAEAEALSRTVLAERPDDTDALQMLARALFATGRSADALDCLRRVAGIEADSPAAHANLGRALAAAGDLPGACDSLTRALGLDGARAEVRSMLASVLQALGRHDDLEACCRAGLAIDPADPGLARALAAALFEQGRVDEALVVLREAIARDAQDARLHSDLLRMLNYAEGQDPAEVFAAHREWAARHADPLTAAAPVPANDPDPERRLRVGYVSPHLRMHAVSFFLESVLAHHDRSAFEVVLYADVERPDAVSRRLAGHASAWHGTAVLDDAAFADRVRADAVDILVDLTGHTPRHRLLAFARRPAPVQATWNGYPNTTGMRAVDHRITDAACDPPGLTERHHTETLVRLPGPFMSWQVPDDAPEVVPPPALSQPHVTFGSFNGCYKITPRTAALWARVLAAVPGSRLLLFAVDGAVARARLRDLLLANGVAESCFAFEPRLPHRDFLAAHARADIALDPFPYHGTTTTCFSLWMGLPVIALAGEVAAARAGVSLLHAAGCADLVAADEDAYVGIAARLAADRPALARRRARMREVLRAAPLTDGRACARALEAAYRTMWRGWCAGPPRTGDEALR